MTSPLPPLAATMFTMAMTIISISLAITKPLVSLSGYYDLHLFPEYDKIDYQVSTIHKISQWMHILALVFACISFVLLVVTMFFSGNFLDETQKDMTIISTVTTTVSAACYGVGISTLIKMAVDYKHMADDLPIPTPNAKIETGTIMDLVGVMSSLIAAVLVVTAVVKTSREGYIRLL